MVRTQPGMSGSSRPALGNPPIGNHAGSPNPGGSNPPRGMEHRPPSSRPNAGNYEAPHRFAGSSQHAPANPGVGRMIQHPHGEAMVRSNGRVAVVQGRNGMTIRRSEYGMRRVVVERGGQVYSFNRAGYGHVRAAYAWGGQTYVVRRYYVGGAYFPRFYRPVYYRGVYFDSYVAAHYYSPFYYGWAYRPWGGPVVFSWGWHSSPWYGYYGGYFTPYPTYLSASLWLTDFLVAQTLESAYRERIESARAAQMQYSDNPPRQMATLTPEIKQMIADEVQRQLALESSQASGQNDPSGPSGPPVTPTSYSGVGQMLEDNQVHVLLSSSNIDVTTTTGFECSITQGDAIGIYPGQTGPQGETAIVKVLASAGGGCPANSMVSVSLQDLQEMLNHVRATVDSGLAEMQKNPKLPKPPANVPLKVTPAGFVSAAPAGDPAEAAELQRLNNEANLTESSVVSEEAQPGASASTNVPMLPPQEQPQPSQARTQLRLGMTPADVRRILGNPSNDLVLGTKEILTYSDVKLTFVNGRLTEMQ